MVGAERKNKVFVTCVEDVKHFQKGKQYKLIDRLLEESELILEDASGEWWRVDQYKFIGWAKRETAKHSRK